MKLSDCINFQLTAAQHAVFQYFGGLLSAHGITPAQYGVLACLWERGCLAPKQIGEMVYLEPSSISTVLDRMQKNGLIERNIHPENRRLIQVTLTDKGRELERPVRAIVDEMNQKVLEPFTPQEREVAARVLLTIAQRKFDV